ncbi:MAG TPA: YdeI/OmpD-associated family protein, partial [Actinomycetota bacterium]
ERRFRADRAAWTWFEGQAPSYRKTAIHWVTSAKKPETRERRLDRLIEDSAAGRRVPPLTRPGDR